MHRGLRVCGGSIIHSPYIFVLSVFTFLDFRVPSLSPHVIIPPHSPCVNPLTHLGLGDKIPTIKGGCVSPRAELAERILTRLISNSEKWTAPYGILDGLRDGGKGKYRTITFGVARYLDATICIYSPTRIEVRAQGGLDRYIGGWYASEQEFLNALRGLEDIVGC